jgi:hypothetical protein
MASATSYTRLSVNSDSGSESLVDKSEGDEMFQLPRHSERQRKIYFLLMALLCGVTLGIAMSHMWTVSHSYMHKGTEETSDALVNSTIAEGIGCGRSPEEAKRLGCHFDMMASTWLRDECHDQALLDEMLGEANWTWYLDQEHTKEVPQEVAYSGEFIKLYPLHDFHIAHCVYLWRKLHKAVIAKGPIDEDLYDYKHTHHCTKLIMAWHEPRSTVTRTAPGFPICRKDLLTPDSRV